MPKKPENTEIKLGDVKFLIRSAKSTKRPPYKKAVENMETYLDGISFWIYQGMEIEGIFPLGRSTFIGVEKLLGAFNIVVGGILNPGVKHTIKYEAAGKLANEKVLDELVLREIRRYRVLTEQNFADYVRMDRIEPILVTYEEDYTNLLTKGQKKDEKLTPITTRSAYETTKSKSEGSDWGYVVKTLVTVPTDPESEGELNILNNPNISKAEKERIFPYYTLEYIAKKDERILYVSIQSVFKRIQMLKEEKSIEAKRLIVEPKEIV